MTPFDLPAFVGALLAIGVSFALAVWLLLGAHETPEHCGDPDCPICAGEDT